jgi:hypothetical protein
MESFKKALYNMDSKQALDSKLLYQLYLTCSGRDDCADSKRRFTLQIIFKGA